MNAVDFPRAKHGKLIEIRLSRVSLLGPRAFLRSLPLIGPLHMGRGESDSLKGGVAEACPLYSASLPHSPDFTVNPSPQNHLPFLSPWALSQLFSRCFHPCFVAKSCPTLCDPVDCSPPGSSIHQVSRQEYWSGLSFPFPNWTQISWIGRWILYHWTTRKTSSSHSIWHILGRQKSSFRFFCYRVWKNPNELAGQHNMLLSSSLTCKMGTLIMLPVSLEYVSYIWMSSILTALS